MLKVFAKRDHIAARFLNTAIAAEDFESRSKASKYGISTDDTFGCQPGHPFMDSLGKFGEYVSPVTDFVRSY